MVVVTLLAAVCGLFSYVGQQNAIVQQRKQLIHSGRVTGIATTLHCEKIPWLRRWLGDAEWISLTLFSSESDETLDQFKRAFPEATVDRYSPLPQSSNGVTAAGGH